MSWKAVKNVRAFLADRGTKRTRDAHSMRKRIAHWSYCEHCGLVGLKNDISRRALAAACVTWE